MLLSMAAGVFTSVQAGAQPGGVLHAAQGQVLDGAANPVQLRCVNLSPWLIPEPYLIGAGGLRALVSSPTETRQRLAQLVGAQVAASFWRHWTENFLVAADFRHLHELGFNCVRLPLDYRDILIAPAARASALDPQALAPVDRAVRWGATYGIAVILDLHDAPGGQNPQPTAADVPSNDRVARLWEGPTAAENQRRTVEIWGAIAARYARSGSVGGYDLLNEPSLPGDSPPATLPALYTRIIAAIRARDRVHMLILEGDRYAHDLSALEGIRDPNVMYEFHEYSILNRAWRNPGQSALAPFLALRARTGRPLWLGEFGEETLDWQGRMVRLMSANGIGWAVWPWKRVQLGNGHPVIETIEPPREWTRLARYLTGAWLAHRPSQSEAQRAMQAMLQAIQTRNCREDSALARVLSGAR
ncbi:MAG TPA: cellulase family glycosylhydrolase [Steroidobacteraceae bacterium]|nr:cellulase family glycosylhydrolase [Steroidobacteraceae bacterium]